MLFTSALPGVSTLRLIKTLRPLRSLQRIRGMRVLVQTILEAMPQMCNVIVFLFFVIFFFGLLGCALFKGLSLASWLKSHHSPRKTSSANH